MSKQQDKNNLKASDVVKLGLMMAAISVWPTLQAKAEKVDYSDPNQVKRFHDDMYD